MIKYNKTKIIATIGPASSSKETLKKLITTGVDVCRLNFSHSSYEEHSQIIKNIREINKELNTNVAILADLQGPKIRIGDIKENTYLEKGKEIYFTTKPCIGNSKKVFINYPQFPVDVGIGEKILIDDGKIQLKVIKTNKKDEVLLEILQGGYLYSKKGVNLPNTKISLPPLTEKDIKDIDFILKKQIEWIALSFVRSVKDIVEIKTLIKNKNPLYIPGIIAKIEKPEALSEIDEIIEEADGLMIARGDLGIEIPIEQVPHIQKSLIKKSILSSKPVMIATQMLESMTENITPLRSEVTDIANAVIDGANAVMLSGETSIGKHPVHVVETMVKIITETENDEDIYYRLFVPEKDNNENYLCDMICHTACNLARETDAHAIIAFTHTGYSAFKLSAQRPKSDIFVFTDNKKILTKLNLLWGVRAFYYNKQKNTDITIKELKNFLKEKKLLNKGDLVINLSSIPIEAKGKTNMLKLSYVE